MLGHANRIGEPVSDEGRKRDDQGKDPVSAQKRGTNYDNVERKEETRPPDRALMQFRLIGMQGFLPFVNWNFQ